MITFLEVNAALQAAKKAEYHGYSAELIRTLWKEYDAIALAYARQCNAAAITAVGIQGF